MRIGTACAAAVLALSCASPKPTAQVESRPSAPTQEAPLRAAASVAPASVTTTTSRGDAAAEPPRVDTAPATPAPPTPQPDETVALLARSPLDSTSIGAPGQGVLRGGVRLPKRGPGFVHNDKRPDDARHGTVELVQAIARAAAVVDAALPGSVLVVNDLSLPEGGPIAQHGSHQNGRDADILFYVLDRLGAPIPSVGVPIEPDGRGVDFKELSKGDDDIALRLDAKRTWRFVAALIDALGDDLQRIFIVEHVRSMLLAEATRAKAPKATVTRFEDVTCQPSVPHDDHMHVRLFCSAEDMAQGCLDKPPVFPFRTAALAALGLVPVLERPGAARDRAKAVAERTTSPSEARRRAGPMHAAVRRFLARRKAWQTQPHPGREFCK